MAKSIMVVDDDPDLREATEIVLSSAGYSVQLAASAAEALEMIPTTAVDLFILDVMMETETEGFHLAYKIRQMDDHKNTPIIMLTCIEERTGQVLDPDKSGDFLPVQSFLRKPMDSKTLKAKVAELLN